MITTYQERSDFNEMLKALNVIMKRNDDNAQIRYVFEILLQTVKLLRQSNRYSVVYPINDQISELTDMTIYHHFRTYQSGSRSWHSRPKSIELICDYLYQILMQDILVVETTFFGAWSPMLKAMKIPFDVTHYKAWDCEPRQLIVPDFSNQFIFSPVTL